MKTLNQNFADELTQKSQNYFVIAELSRRELNDPGTVGSDIDITKWLINVNPINWKLDTNALNEWKVSNVNIEVDNKDNVWDDISGGIWQDGTDYIPYRSWIRLRIGNYFDGGTENKPPFTPGSNVNYVYVFDGRITSIVYHPETQTATIQIAGQEFLLKATSAEEASNKVSNETLYGIADSGTASSDPSNDANGYFYDTSKSWGINAYAGYILKMVDGTAASNEYDIDANTATRLDCTGDNLYSEGIRSGDAYKVIKYDGDGTMTIFETANVGVGRIDVVDKDAVKQDRGSDYDISQTNDADLPGQIIMTAAPSSAEVITCDYVYWYQDQTIEELIEILVLHAGITNYNIDPVVFDGAITEVTEDACAEWTGIYKKMECVSDELVLVDQYHYVLIDNVTAYSTDRTDTGTMGWDQKETDIRFNLNPSVGEPTHWRLEVTDNSDVVQWTKDYWFPAGTTVIEVLDFSQWFSESDTFKIKRIELPGNTGTTSLLKVRYPASDYAVNGEYTSDTIDCGVSLVSYNIIEYSVTLPSNTTVTVYTQSSTNGSSWDARVQTGPSGAILSVLKRYLRYVLILTSNGTATPEISSVTVSYTTSSFTIELADFTSLSCWDALAELADISGYEFGVGGDSYFFFRPRGTAGDVVFNFDDNVSLIDILDYDPGYDRIFNLVKATFGIYTEIQSPDTEGEGSPNSFDWYGERELVISGGNLLADDNVNIATSICSRYYSEYKLPQKTAKIRLKMLPMLDLGDIIKLPYYRGGTLIWNERFRIMGIKIDTNKWELEIDLRGAET